MSEKSIAILGIEKALLTIPFTAFASIGSAIAGLTGNYSLAIFWAGLSAIPAASLTVYDPVKSQVTKLINLMSRNNQQLKIPKPNWWTSDSRSWQNACMEIDVHLSAILERMTELMHQDQRVKTTEVVQQAFIDALVQQHLTWAPDPKERRRIAEVLAPPIWQEINQMLSPVIEQIQKEETLRDIRNTALNTKEAADLLSTTAALMW